MRPTSGYSIDPPEAYRCCVVAVVSKIRSRCYEKVFLSIGSVKSRKDRQDQWGLREYEEEVNERVPLSFTSSSYSRKPHWSCLSLRDLTLPMERKTFS